MPKARRITAYVVLFAVAVSLAYVVGCVERRHRLRVGFESIRAGQTRQEVLELLGEPSDVEGCGGWAANECAEVYRYVSFMEWRFVVLDRGGKVVEKFLSVSP